MSQQSDRNRLRDEARAMLHAYLEKLGLDTRKPFKCLNPAHQDNNPSMSFDPKTNRVKCFACSWSGDIFDLIGMEHGIVAFSERLDKAAEVLGLSFTGTASQGAPKQRPLDKGQYPVGSEQNPARLGRGNDEDQTKYFNAIQDIGSTPYLRDRGISDDTARKLGIRYDPNFKPWPAVIIPTSPFSYLARNIAQDASGGNKVRKKGGVRIFNLQAAIEAKRPIFVTEGEIDAASIIELGGNAVGIGGVASVRLFCSQVKEAKDRITSSFIIAMDNDDPGKKAAGELKEGLAAIGMKHYECNVSGQCKDPNERLQQDREGLKSAIQCAENGEAGERAQEVKDYLAGSAAHRVVPFIEEVKQGKTAKPVATGFAKIDEELGDGLYPGLYIMGAVSSLGKTTLALQIADQIAQQGRDVLFFSLEMDARELMAKSLSRLTFMHGRSEVDALTVRGIDQAARYEGYGPRRITLIDAAVNAYRSYADFLFIHEGHGVIGTKEIRAEIERHIDMTASAPVVFIDYLQLLAPYEDRATDKQNTDRAVLDLKKMSRSFGIPIMAVSSLNRANYEKKVAMQAFKESGAIEYSADVLLGLQFKGADKSDFDIDQAKRENIRSIEMVVLKNRNGRTGGNVSLQYQARFNYMYEESGGTPGRPLDFGELGSEEEAF